MGKSTPVSELTENVHLLKKVNVLLIMLDKCALSLCVIALEVSIRFSNFLNHLSNHVANGRRNGFFQYRHKSCGDYMNIGPRIDVTSTGHMLDIHKEAKRSTPGNPPEPFDLKSQTLYKQVNPFSYHDNRNTIQLEGEYLGNVSKYTVFMIDFLSH